MNTKLLEGYIGYTTYLDTFHKADVIKLHSGKWWKFDKKFLYPRLPQSGNYYEDPRYEKALSIVEEYFK